MIKFLNKMFYVFVYNRQEFTEAFVAPGYQPMIEWLQKSKWFMRLGFAMSILCFGLFLPIQTYDSTFMAALLFAIKAVLFLNVFNSGFFLFTGFLITIVSPYVSEEEWEAHLAESKERMRNVI